MKLNQLLILPFCTFFLLACNSNEQTDESSSDSKKKKDSQVEASEKKKNRGSSSFVVSGEQEGEYSGIAYFKSFERNGMHSWGITLIDQPMTFTISFAQTGGEAITPPEVGTYDLGINHGNRSDDIYMASFEYFESDPKKRLSYSVGIGNSSGVMEITKSTEELIEGTFTFTAVRFERGEAEGNIEVTDGEFSAVLTQ